MPNDFLSASNSLRYCRAPDCQNLLMASQLDWVRRRFERVHCSFQCKQADWQSLGLCCFKAKIVECNCALSSQCPDHGRKCRGTHD